MKSSRTMAGFSRLLALSVAIGALPCAGFNQPQSRGTSAVTGTVHDGSGNGVAEASVRLQAQGDGRAEEHKTDTSGSFVFSELRTGTYVLSASKGERHSSEITVTLTTAGSIQRVELTLTSSDEHLRAQMEYADAPNFTVAAVTDWTAAGGHGSDTTLRTSEALNRDTMHLKPTTGKTAIAGPIESENEGALRAALEKAPQDLKANENLGRFYLNGERYSDALPPLRTAYDLDKANEENEYYLAVALTRTGSLVDARGHIAQLLSKGDRPEWHRVAGELAERSGDSLTAVREFERAAKGDPSEENYFAWGSELLEHRAIWQAKDVFEAGAKAYPTSERMLTALGAALFGAALYEDAARRLCEASDLSPIDAHPYLFMGKVEAATPNSLPCIETKLQRFVQMQPGNPLANLYYALSYWKEHGKRVDPEIRDYVKTYLNRAVKADPGCSDAYLQLGILEATQADFAAAAELYRKALAANPQSTEAHYRLGVAYDRLGDKQRAAEEFRRHDELEKEQAAIVDRQRKEVKQFLVQAEGNGQRLSEQP
ncbi:MAG: tetratricopeptide repeat protein [Acidobacteria bacterium]|nr:tetratricopeptide repeat protein [Acidobacteriota bacterium]